MPDMLPSSSNLMKMCQPKTNKTRKQMGYRRLFGGGRVLGDSLGTLRDGVLGKFTGQDKSHTVKRESEMIKQAKTRRDLRGLDLSRRDGGLLVVCSKL
jgi:hypothetical protein